MSRKRTPGGEVNQKSGTKWAKDELIQVYVLYKELNGEQLHESNPKIIELANKLGRTVRSTEAQTLMFRSLERGGEYGHKNMNKLCREIWNEYEDNYQINQHMISPLNNWTSESLGGVRRPFDHQTGRPAGKDRFDTPISNRLKNLINGERNPNAIFLVGGPGNGKTDTLEFIIELLDIKFKCNGKLINRVSNQFENYSWVESIDTAGLNLPYSTIQLVQDASDSDQKQGADQALLSAFKQLCENYDGLFVCCINRGILDRVKRATYQNEEVSDEVRIYIKSLSTSVTPTAPFENISCWPFVEGSYAWPMDVDSLVELKDDSPNPFQLILDKATKRDLWASYIHNCSDSVIYNLKELSNDEVVRNVSSILRKCEINTSYRFSFRDLFSFTAQIIGEADKATNQKIYSDPKISFERRFKAIHTLWEGLYYNKLFSDKIITQRLKGHIDLIKRIKKNEAWEADDHDIRNVLRVVAQRKRSSKSAIERLLNQVDIQSLDPGRSSSTERVFGVEKIYSFSDMEFEFSKSIEYGISLCRNELSEIDINYLKLLADVEKYSLFSGSIAKNYVRVRDQVAGLLRKYACICAKRAIGVKSGYLKNNEILEEFIAVLQDNNKAHEFIYRQLSPALFDDNKFIFSFNSTIGQPKENLVHDSIIRFDSIKSIKHIDLDTDEYPNWTLIGLNFNGKTYIINYKLFEAMYRKGIEKESPSSLKPEVLLAMDNIVSSFASPKIRDHHEIASGYVIEVGDQFLLDVNYDGTYEKRD